LGSFGAHGFLRDEARPHPFAVLDPSLSLGQRASVSGFTLRKTNIIRESEDGGRALGDGKGGVWGFGFDSAGVRAQRRMRIGLALHSVFPIVERPSCWRAPVPRSH
jgi:hypothetical protein